jgi:hypothetical protein
MNTSIYAPPKADLSMPKEVIGDGFYVVSRRKFLVMYLMTLGLYKIYWFYKNWSMYKAIERAEGGADSDIWPVPRALFCVFFVHALLREASAYASAKQREVSDGFEALATVLVILLLVSNVIDRLSTKGIGSPLTDYVSLALLFPMVWFFNLARQFINDASGDSAGMGNDTFTWANWIWIVIGAILWLGIITDLYMVVTGKKFQ